MDYSDPLFFLLPIVIYPLIFSPFDNFSSTLLPCPIQEVDPSEKPTGLAMTPSNHKKHQNRMKNLRAKRRGSQGVDEDDNSEESESDESESGKNAVEEENNNREGNSVTSDLSSQHTHHEVKVAHRTKVPGQGGGDTVRLNGNADTSEMRATIIPKIIIPHVDGDGVVMKSNGDEGGSQLSLTNDEALHNGDRDKDKAGSSEDKSKSMEKLKNDAKNEAKKRREDRKSRKKTLAQIKGVEGSKPVINTDNMQQLLHPDNVSLDGTINTLSEDNDDYLPRKKSRKLHLPQVLLSIINILHYGYYIGHLTSAIMKLTSY